jgi:multidrug resistance efflux pump
MKDESITSSFILSEASTMITRTRNFVLLGMFLLVGTVVGAGWVLHQPAAGDGPTANGNSSDGMAGVLGLGYVDVEPGITYLHPVQQGRVTQVFVKEGDEIRAGDLLLTIDSTMARKRLAAAQAELDAAKHKLADAEDKLPKDHQREIDIQQAKLLAGEYELKAAQKGLDIQRKLNQNKGNQLVSDDQLAETENKVKAVEATVKAQRLAVDKAKDFDPKGTLDQLRDQVRAKTAQRDEAREAVLECDLYAPADGVILRLYATVGETLSAASKTPAVHFCPNLPRIIRVEILQEWASKIQVGRDAFIEDDTRNGAQWKGKVARVSDWFTQRRSVLLEPFQYNDVRTLECIVYVDRPNSPLRIGQRVRVTIK